MKGHILMYDYGLRPGTEFVEGLHNKPRYRPTHPLSERRATLKGWYGGRALAVRSCSVKWPPQVAPACGFGLYVGSWLPNEEEIFLCVSTLTTGIRFFASFLPISSMKSLIKARRSNEQLLCGLRPSTTHSVPFGSLLKPPGSHPNGMPRALRY